jgi:hypothetical protein
MLSDLFDYLCKLYAVNTPFEFDAGMFTDTVLAALDRRAQWRVKTICIISSKFRPRAGKKYPSRVQQHHDSDMMDKRSLEREMIPVISYCTHSVHLRVVGHADAFRVRVLMFHSGLTSLCVYIVLQLERLAG